MSVVVAFADIAQLRPFDPISFESPLGSVSGYVSEVVPGEHVSIMTGGSQATTRITAESCEHGVLTIPEVAS
ncbi:MAG: hypothetical protein J0I43_01795 [Microbacterium sp.]|mgnify:CR=1 FL=1|uniref:hypothetical protein n=1 Tax=Microbacterium sp. TaxID=51671 RepID=UPI001AC1AE3A|nr:hypothetical protein [Microbacterium sp.]MBN9176091.1 hypothetical protein [Microbacterium sp.]